MEEIRVGMKFGSYYGVLSNAERNGRILKQSSHSFDNGRGLTTNTYMKNGHLSKSKRGSMVEVEYTTEKFMFRGDGHLHADQFSRIYAKNAYAIDLNGNGIVDKGEIFK